MIFHFRLPWKRTVVTVSSHEQMMRTEFLRHCGLKVLVAMLPLLAGCGDDPPPPDATAPTGPPGAVESTVMSAAAFPARKIEVRLLQPPALGTLSTGGEITVYTTPGVREPTETGEMVLVGRAETNDFGKFKIDNVPPGDYLLSAGTFSTGIWREWVKVEPGTTASPPIKLPQRK